MASTLTNLLYHVVFSTKNRKPLITLEIQESLYKYIGGIIRNQRGILLEIGGMPDHVHLLARFPASKSVSDMLRDIKSDSSKWLGEKDSGHPFAWQSGYGAFTASQSQVETLRKYIQTQEKHHRRKSFKEELVGLLKRHDVEYDERYLWD